MGPRRTNTKTTTTALLLVVTLMAPLWLASGCAPSESQATSGPDVAGTEAKDDEKKDDAVPVAAFPLQRGEIESVLRYSTNLEAEVEVQVFSEAARRITELLVEEGNRVGKGQVLVRLQDDEQRNALAKIDSQLAQARREYERQERLYDQEMIPEQAFNQATYDLEQLELAKADAERELGYTEVRAPVSGVITQRLVNLGDTVQRNQHLFDIVDFGTIVARIFVPERELARLERGQGARVYASGLDAEPRRATIDRIAPTVDSRSGTVRVTLAIPDRQGLVPGMFVEVELIAGLDRDALLVPKRALIHDQDQVFVYRVAEQGETGEGEPRTIVERLLIEPVLEDRFFVEVEGDQLAEGDRVVIAGQAGLKPGSTVRLLDLEEAMATFGGEELLRRSR